MWEATKGQEQNPKGKGVYKSTHHVLPAPAPPLEEAHRPMKASYVPSPLCQAHVESQFLSEQSMD